MQAEGPAGAPQGFSDAACAVRSPAALEEGGPGTVMAALGLVSVDRGDEPSFPGRVPESLEPELEPEHSFLSAGGRGSPSTAVWPCLLSQLQCIFLVLLHVPFRPQHLSVCDQQAFTSQSCEWRVGAPGGWHWSAL